MAGGGGGSSGGGGAGGVRELTGVALVGTLDVIVGAGGAGTASGTAVGDSGGDTSLGPAATLVPTMSSNSAPSGVASASTEFSSTYAAWKALNGTYADASDSWASSAGNTSGWLRYQFADATVVSCYAIRTRNAGIAGDVSAPKTWTFEGSDDGTNWTTLDTQTNVTAWDGLAAVRSFFSFVNTTAYAYYRLNISSSNGSSFVCVGELELLDAIALGGGGGGKVIDNVVPPPAGGSGGGAGASSAYNNKPGGAGYSGQGNAGGSNAYNGSPYPAGGGGGAGASGQAGQSNSVAGQGGAGITWHGADYAGGGGGGLYAAGGTAGTASYGGGAGAVASATGTAGTANTGGGGGGSGYVGTGATGGSGIVVIRYLTPGPKTHLDLSSAWKTWDLPAITLDGDYTVAKFSVVGPHQFVPPVDVTDAEILVVAGGGGGSAGGGGAGGYQTDSDYALTPGEAVDLTVGAGGVGRAGQTVNGDTGSDSTFGTILAYGGGGGGMSGATGGTGGSGGGGGYGTSTAQHGLTLSYGQGNNGGDARGLNSYDNPAGGGGGAFSAGSDAVSDYVGGPGGLGIANDITGTSLTYAVGGVGGKYMNVGADGADGTAGRGNGGSGSDVYDGHIGGSGGSGVVIVRWLTPRTILDLDSEWATHAPPQLHLDSAWETRAPIWRLPLDSAWLTHGSPRLNLDSTWKTDDLWMYAHDVFSLTGRAQIAESSLAMHVRHDGFRLTCKERPHLGDAYVGDLSAHVAFFSGSHARMNNVGDPEMPAYATSSLRPSVFFNHGFALGIEGVSHKTGILDVSIELSDHGGFISATIVTAQMGGGTAPAMYSECVISCGGQTFRGRLESREKNVGAVAGYTLTYAGPMTKLRDHRGFRRCYVTSDLDNWSTDQGPRSSPDTFEVISRSSGNTA